jgi:hypothetical protein
MIDECGFGEIFLSEISRLNCKETDPLILYLTGE